MSVHAGWDAPDTLELQAVPVDTHTIERIREVRAGVQAAVGTLRRGRLT
jgi:hypothetical protein